MGGGFGGGDFTEGSLFYEAVQSFLNGKTFELRNPHSVRPWIHVLDQVNGLLKLAEALYDKGPKLSETYNLGAVEYETVGSVMAEFRQEWNHADSTAAVAGDFSEAGKNLSLHGQLNSELAKKDFSWEPHWSVSKGACENGGVVSAIQLIGFSIFF